jgi:hypothetical protein
MTKYLGSLPVVYQNSGLAVALGTYFDERVDDVLARVDGFEDKLLDPQNADTHEDLDYLALLYGLRNLYWNESWSIPSKRAMLDFDVIKNRGSARSLSHVLFHAGYPNIIELAGDFLVNISEVGDPIGIAPWTYELTLPERFAARMFEIDLICYFWQPAWLKRITTYDDEPFTLANLWKLGDAAVYAYDDDNPLQIGETVQ